MPDNPKLPARHPEVIRALMTQESPSYKDNCFSIYPAKDLGGNKYFFPDPDIQNISLLPEIPLLFHGFFEVL